MKTFATIALFAFVACVAFAEEATKKDEKKEEKKDIEGRGGVLGGVGYGVGVGPGLVGPGVVGSPALVGAGLGHGVGLGGVGLGHGVGGGFQSAHGASAGGHQAGFQKGAAGHNQGSGAFAGVTARASAPDISRDPLDSRVEPLVTRLDSDSPPLGRPPALVTRAWVSTDKAVAASACFVFGSKCDRVPTGYPLGTMFTLAWCLAFFVRRIALQYGALT
ncbi:hypothetical protein V5799_019411 [Amblyomma americanum]|uniref:Uncharacterized protein n=1 Tax=Amblyomma americanum TaxID=6943 RepID=A0AAQ4EXB2_AMBAM